MIRHPFSSLSLPNEFLAKLLSEIDDDTVTTIILHGSYARVMLLPRIVTLIWYALQRKRLIKPNRNTFCGMKDIF